MLISPSKVSNLFQNGQFPIYFQSILATIFVITVMVKVKLLQYYYTWAIVLINQYNGFCERQILVFGLIEGGGAK